MDNQETRNLSLDRGQVTLAKTPHLTSSALVDEDYLTGALKIVGLGKGSYGKINLVRTWDDRIHAVKYMEIPEDGLTNSQLGEANALTRFRNAESMIQLVGICYASTRRLAMILEPLDSDLHAFQQKIKFSERLALLRPLFQSMIKALSLLEAFNMSHFDIKPENILVKVDGGTTTFKLADFGFAQIIPITSLITSDVVYTRPYRPPEFLCGISEEYLDSGGEITSDIWALALVLIEFITGQVVFPAEDDAKVKLLTGQTSFTAASLILKHLPSELFDEIDRDLVDIITRMLSLKPEERPTASKLLATFSQETSSELFQRFSSPLYPRVYHDRQVPLLIKIGTQARMSKACIIIAIELFTRYLALVPDLSDVFIVLCLTIASDFFEKSYTTMDDFISHYRIIVNKALSPPAQHYIQAQRKILLDLNFEIYDTHLTEVIQRAYNDNIDISTIDPITFSQPVTDWLK